MSAIVTPPGVRAIDALLASLETAGIAATRDAGSFYPQPTGVLVGLPALVSRGAYTRTFEVPVLAVSADPLNTTPAVDRLYALADDLALVLNTAAYRVSSFGGGVNSEGLPALELTVTVSIEED